MHKLQTLVKFYPFVIHILSQNEILSPVHRVSVVASKVQLISFLPVQFSRMLGKDICLIILKFSQLGNFYLEKKTQQSKITNHSSCKFKILLLSQADSFKLA